MAARLAAPPARRAHREQGPRDEGGAVPAQRQVAVHGEQGDPEGRREGEQRGDEQAQRAAAVQGAVVWARGVRGCAGGRGPAGWQAAFRAEQSRKSERA